MREISETFEEVMKEAAHGEFWSTIAWAAMGIVFAILVFVAAIIVAPAAFVNWRVRAWQDK